MGGDVAAGGAGGGAVFDPSAAWRKPAPAPLDVSTNACAAPLAARLTPARLRRLTRRELVNTVRSVLLPSALPAIDLPPDAKPGVFLSNADVSPSDTDLATYQQFAEEFSNILTRTDQQVKGLLSPCRHADTAVAANAWPKALQDQCAGQLLDGKGALLLRRPIADADRAAYLALYAAQPDFVSGLRALVEALLASPRFLYHVEIGVPAPELGAGVRRLDDYELAERLSYALWGGPPTAGLLAAAARGELRDDAGVEAWARRMLADPRAQDLYYSFHEQLFQLDRYKLAAKDPDVFPMFEGWKGLFEKETRKFLDEVAFSGLGTFEALLTGRFTYVNNALADVYGLPRPNPPGDSSDPHQRVEITTQARAGLLTQGAFLAGHAGNAETSITQRGLAVRRNLLCQSLPDPPPGTAMDPDVPRTVQQPCATCHVLIDFIGQGLEQFDAVGAYRTTDVHGARVTTSGQLLQVGGGVPPAFDGAVELGARLVATPDYRACVAVQWLRFSLGRDLTAADECDMARVQAALAAAGGNIADTVVALVKLDTFRYVYAGEPACTGGTP